MFWLCIYFHLHILSFSHPSFTPYLPHRVPVKRVLRLKHWKEHLRSPSEHLAPALFSLSLRSHSIKFKKFSWGRHPQTPLATVIVMLTYRYVSTGKLGQCNFASTTPVGKGVSIQVSL